MKENDVKEPEVLPGEDQVDNSLLTQLSRGAAIQRVENESLLQMALQRPRKPMEALENALAELDLDPSFAEKQYYEIEYGGGEGKKTIVTGLSVKAAMALARCWGNLSVSARVVDEDDQDIYLDGVAIDLQTGFRIVKTVAVSKFYKRKGTKQMVKWSDDRRPQIIGIGASKAARNAILNIIPEPYSRRYWEKSKALAAEQIPGKRASKKTKAAGRDIDYARVVPAILEKFAPFGVEREHLEKKIEAKLDETTRDQITTLKGFLNSLEQGQQDAFQLFGVGGPAVEEPQDAAGGSPLNPQKGGADGPEG